MYARLLAVERGRYRTCNAAYSGTRDLGAVAVSGRKRRGTRCNASFGCRTDNASRDDGAGPGYIIGAGVMVCGKCVNDERRNRLRDNA